MDVSIIIVNYNTEKLILDCLDSIYEKTEGLEFEVIVVDNDSPDKPDILKEDKRIKYIQSEKNLGFGKANNLGAEYAEGEYLFCLNPDTLLLNNAIKILYDYFIRHKEVGICGPNQYNINDKPGNSFSTMEYGILFELLESRGITSRYISHFNKKNEPIDVKNVSGAALFIKKELFNKIGGFDKDIFMYFEDNIICYEVSKLGYRIVNIPEAIIKHLEGQSFILRTHHSDLYMESRKKFIIRRYGPVYFCISNIILSINSIINILYAIIARKKEIQKIQIYNFNFYKKIYY